MLVGSSVQKLTTSNKQVEFDFDMATQHPTGFQRFSK